jgi:hypothetical protein
MFVEHKEVGDTQITKVSQAIRIGSCFRPQAVGEPFIDGGSCAIGAAYEALGGPMTDEIKSDTGPAWEYVAKKLGLEVWMCIPDEEGKLRELCEHIFSKNDDGWTREQVADWLESQGL